MRGFNFVPVRSDAYFPEWKSAFTYHKNAVAIVNAVESRCPLQPWRVLREIPGFGRYNGRPTKIFYFLPSLSSAFLFLSLLLHFVSFVLIRDTTTGIHRVLLQTRPEVGRQSFSLVSTCAVNDNGVAVTEP